MNYFYHFIISALLIISAGSTISGQQSRSFELVAKGLNFPEGPAFDGSNHIYVSNCHGGWITRLSLAGKADTFQTSDRSDVRFGQTNGLAFYKDGSLYACDYGKGAILTFNTKKGRSSIVLNGYNGHPFNRPNDLAFDWDGNLYFTDPKSYGKNIPDGVVYKYDVKNKSLNVIIDSLCFPNGIAFSPDRKYLYVCESAKERILRFDISKQYSAFEVFAVLPGGDPDGIAFDKDGNLYAAHFGGGAVYVFDSNGKVIEKIPAPGKKPSNLEFAGSGLKTLYLTETETNAVYKLNNTIPGARLFSAPRDNRKRIHK